MREQSDFATLTDETYNRGISELAARDPDLADTLSRWGNPPFWTHPPGFPGIVIAVLAQQVSLESAEAAFHKLEDEISSVDPERFLSLDGDKLRAIGFSRQKATYIREAARRLVNGEIVLESLGSMDNDEARRRLMDLKGIGVWTADAYLLFALRRADAWPSGDLALAKAIKELKGLAAKPSPEDVDRIADDWRPWRAIAARILWHRYLSERGRFASP